MPIILVVEDDHLMLKAIGSILNRGGFSVHHAPNGKEAIEMLEHTSYDIVVTDLMMPFAGGLEVVSRIRGDSAKRNTGVIVVSSMAQEDMIIEALNLGADDFLKKPVMAGELVSRIRKLLVSKNLSAHILTEKTVADDTDDDVAAPDDMPEGANEDAEMLPGAPRFLIPIHKFVEEQPEPVPETAIADVLTTVFITRQNTAMPQPQHNEQPPAERRTLVKTYPEIMQVGNIPDAGPGKATANSRKTYYIIGVLIIAAAIALWILIKNS